MRTRFVHAILSAGFLSAVSMSVFASGAIKVDPAPPMSTLRVTPPSTSGTGNELYANPDRAYPPSCLQAPLQTGLWQDDPNRAATTVKLSGDLYGGSTEAAYTENDTVIVFRVPCLNGRSALLIEIDRPASLEGNTTSYPVVPLVGIYVSNGIAPLRIAQDPNTFLSNVVAGVPLYNSTVFVAENFYGSGLDFDFNAATSIYVDNLLRDANQDVQAVTVSAYDPSKYAANSLPLPISGYQSGNFYDHNHSGEGIQVEVGDLTQTTRVITIAWYTFDATGTPYWLYGTQSFDIGATSVPVTLYYGSDGGFAGNFGKATFAAWGNITVSFPDCNTMNFTYASNAGLPSSVPIGSGSKTWARLTQLNGLTCQ